MTAARVACVLLFGRHRKNTSVSHSDRPATINNIIAFDGRVNCRDTTATTVSAPQIRTFYAAEEPAEWRPTLHLLQCSTLRGRTANNTGIAVEIAPEHVVAVPVR